MGKPIGAVYVLAEGDEWPDGTTSEDFAKSVAPWLSWLNCTVEVESAVTESIIIEDCIDGEHGAYEAAIQAVYDAVWNTETDDDDPVIPRSVLVFMERVGLDPFPEDMDFSVDEGGTRATVAVQKESTK